MKKIQEDLRKFFSQYDFVKVLMRYDIIFLFIFPVYGILNLLPVDFMYTISKFSGIFLLLFVVGLAFCFANNKLKEIMAAAGIQCLLAIVGVVGGYFNDVIYVLLYGAVVYFAYREVNGKPVNITKKVPNNNNNNDNNNNNNNNNEVLETVRKCKKCGNEIGDKKFCRFCGEKVDE